MAHRRQVLEIWRVYYNPEDERLLPPKRIAWMGWTTNFANSKSVALLVVILFLVLFLIALLPKSVII